MSGYLFPILGSFSMGYFLSEFQNLKKLKEKQEKEQLELQKTKIKEEIQSKNEIIQLEQQFVQQQVEEQELFQKAGQLIPGALKEPIQIIDQSPYYISYYDKQRKIPIAVDEIIRPENLKGYADRKNSRFHNEQKIDEKFQSTLNDYYQAYHILDVNRGHMSAASNHKYDQKAMNSSFSLSNILPQNSDNNADLWFTFEVLSKFEAENNEFIRVISGPIFLPEQVDLKQVEKPKHVNKFFWKKIQKGDKYIGNIEHKVIGDNKVYVPTHLYKIFHIFGKNGEGPQLGCFIVPNTPYDKIDKKLKDWQVPLEEVEKLTGIDFHDLRKFENLDYCNNEDGYCNKTQREIDYQFFKKKFESTKKIQDSAWIEDNIERKKQKLTDYQDLYDIFKQQVQNGIDECKNYTEIKPYWKTEKPCDKFDCYTQLNKLLFKSKISKYEPELTKELAKQAKQSMKKCDDQDKIEQIKENILKYSMKDSIFRQNFDYIFPKQEKQQQQQQQ